MLVSLLFCYLLGLIVAAKHLGWVFWKPSIIWHILNFSSFSSDYSTSACLFASNISDLGPFSKHTHSAHFSVLPLTISFPHLEHLSSSFLQRPCLLLKPRSVSFTFTMISRIRPFRSDGLLSFDSLVLC